MARGSSTRAYKGPISHDRVLTEERNFSAGMLYTDAEVGSGNARVLVNLETDKATQALKAIPKPRCSMRAFDCNSTGYNYQEACSGLLSVQVDSDSERFIEAHVCVPTAQYDSKMPCTLANGLLIITVDGDDVIYHYVDCTTDASLLQGDDEVVPIACMYIPKMTPAVHVADPTCVAVGAEYIPNAATMYGAFPTVFIMNGKLFAYVYTDYRDAKFHKSADTSVSIKEYEGLYSVDTSTWKLIRVAPKDVAVSNAVSSGYNLLKDDPYSFSVRNSATGEVELEGLVPKQPASGQVLLRTKVNTQVRYDLAYAWPQTDASDKYLVAWKIQDNASSKDPEVLQALKKSTEYTPGDAISITFNVPYDNFTLICELYKKSEMSIEDEAWENSEAIQALVLKEDYHTPNRTITVTSAYIADASKGTTVQDSPIVYAANRPKGAVVWKQRCVTWGYRTGENGSTRADGPNVLIISDANDPSYVPYPNNALIFDDDVLACTTYRDALIVFTKHAMHKVVFEADGITPNCTLVQSGMYNSDTLAADILSDNNFVFMRTNAGYSMVCPSQYTASGLQVVSISDSLGDVLKQFSRLLDDVVYALYPKLKDAEVTAVNDFLKCGVPANGEAPVIKDPKNDMLMYVDQWDYTSFINNAKYLLRGHVLYHIPMQNIFMDMYKIMLPVSCVQNHAYAPVFINVCLCYNTMTRNWSLRVERACEQMPFVISAGADFDKWLTVADGHWYKPVQRAYNNVWEVPHTNDL